MPAQHRFYLPLQPRVLFGHPSTRQKISPWPLGELSIYTA